MCAMFVMIIFVIIANKTVRFMTTHNTFATCLHAFKLIDFNDNYRSKKEQYARIVMMFVCPFGIASSFIMTDLPSANWFW